MRAKILPIALMATLSWIAPAKAGDVGRSFVATGLVESAPAAAEDFPPAPEAWTRSVQDLSLLLERVRASGRPARATVRTITLHEAVSARAWRSAVVEQLELLFP